MHIAHPEQRYENNQLKEQRKVVQTGEFYGSAFIA
jgi:hypothetical protein